MPPLDESESVRSEPRRKRKRRPQSVASPSRHRVGYRTSDSGEAANRPARVRPQGADSAEAARLRGMDAITRLELRRTNRDLGGNVVNRSEIGDLFASLADRPAPRETAAYPSRGAPSAEVRELIAALKDADAGPDPDPRFAGLGWSPDQRQEAEAVADTVTSYAEAGEQMLGHSLGALLPIAGGTPASEADPRWVLPDAAMAGLPFLRGPRAAAQAVRTVRAGEKVAGIAKPGSKVEEAFTGSRLAREGEETMGRVRLPRRAHAMTGSRTVGYRDIHAQAPSSPSTVTAYGQRLMDRAFEVTGKAADDLRRSDSALARALGASITPVSSRAKVPKLAGKRLRQESRRAKALRAEEFRTIKHVGGASRTGRAAGYMRSALKNEGRALAHFWYYQLPVALRNSEGLDMVRGKLRAEHEAYTSGQVGRQVDESIEEARQIAWDAKRSGDDEGYYGALEEVERLQRIQQDIPSRIVDLGENIAKLERVGKKAPEVDGDVMEAMRVLEDESAEIGIRAGLDVERAAERTGLVSRWLGLTPTGEEGFIPHRMGKTTGARDSILPGGVSVGETRKPKGLFRENQLALASTGRLRQDLDVVLETWQERQVYELTNIAKGDLSAMGDPVDLIRGVPKGSVLVNPKGHTIPRTWRRDPDKQAEMEGFDEVDDVVIRDVDEYLHNTYAGLADDPAEAAREIAEMMAKARTAGHLEDLRVVPMDVVKRYYGQFVPAKVSVTSLGGRQERNLLGKGADMVNDLLYISLIYSNPGYIPAALVGNLAMAALHQGPFMAVNLARAGQILTTAPKRLRDQLRAEVGHGGTVSAGSGQGKLQKVPQVVGALPDDGPRIAAFLYEASRLGVISKTKPVLTKSDYRKLERFLTDENARPMLNEVSDRAVQAMVDFERLGPMERAFAKRLLFVWPWIRGATRYPGRFALDHPIRSGILAYAALEGRDYLEERTIGADEGPPWMQEAIKTGEEAVAGKMFPTMLRTAPISPVSTPTEMIRSAIADPGARTFGEFLNPGILSLVDSARGLKRSSEGDYFKVGYGEAATSALERLVPNYGLTKDLVNPEGGGLYPGDVSRVGRLKRASRIFPVPYDPEKAKEMAVDQPDSAEKRRTELGADVARARKLFRSVGEKMPDEYREFAERDLLYDLGREDLKEDLEVKKLTEAQETGLLLSIAFAKIPEVAQVQDDWITAYQEARGDPLDRETDTLSASGPMHKLRLRLEEILGFNVLARYETYLDRIERHNLGNG